MLLRCPRWRPLLLSALFLVSASPAIAAGTTPADPIVWNLEGAPASLSFASSSTNIWFRITPRTTIHATHFELRTTGSLDTRLYAYANLADALANEPFADDDDGGEGLNAYLKLPIGFTGPYLVKARAWSGGSSSLSGNLNFATTANRCAWPSGCTLATAAQGETGQAGTLATLRAVRDEILSTTPRGERIADLYWRLGTDLVPAILLDAELRANLYGRIVALLPLAEAALAETRGNAATRPFRAEEAAQLRELLELISPHLAAANAAELDGLWRELDLERRIGQSLATVLTELRLLPDSATNQRLLVKLRRAPDLKSGDFRSGLVGIDDLLAKVDIRGLRNVHANSAENLASGLTSTVAIDVRGVAAARNLLADLAASPEVEWAELDSEVRALATTQDPWSARLWGLDAVKAQLAWTVQTGSCAIPVAVIDTGLRPDLIDFGGRILAGRGWDFANDDNDPQDKHGHGTHVAGTVAANANNLVSVAGVAPSTCFFAVKVLSDSGSGSMEDLAAGIVYAANQGAKVINMSLGCDCTSNAVEEAMAYAASKDVVIIAAAGNDGVEGVLYPASSPWAIGVGAVDSNLNLAEFSNRGEGLDLVAPGVEIVSTFHDGESCLGSGTSMATPHVAGVAALLRAAKPSWNRTQITNLLLQSCRDLGTPGIDPTFGHGLVDAFAALQQADPCAGGLCLQNRRFAVRLTWRDFQGNTGVGKLVPLSSESSGLFYFFNPQNWEVLVKVLNGCGLNQRYWVYAAATTNVEYTLYVTDTVTGATRSYFNPLGVSAPAITDTTAFACSNAAAVGLDQADIHPAGALLPVTLAAPADNTAFPAPSVDLADKALTCLPGDLCLSQNRFKVELFWRDYQNQTGQASKVAGGSSADSGLMWFFQASNWEILVKVLDGCGLNSRFWVFAAATTDVEYTLRITDLRSGQIKEYRNPLGRSAAAITDTAAFATCP